MFNTLEFVMVSVLFLDLIVNRGAQLWTWAKGAFTTVENDVKKL